MIGICEIPFRQYLEIPALSASGIKQILRSPAHFRQAVGPDKAHLRLGRAVHCAVLTPDIFEEEFACANGRRNKAAEKTELTAAEWSDCIGMRDSVRSSRKARELLAVGVAEWSLMWHESLTPCKARPDWRTHTFMVDLKTTQDASPDGFARAVRKYGYHIQAAWYLRGWINLAGDEDMTFIFIAVEKSPPYACGFYALSDALLREGRELCERALVLYDQCVTNDDWPGYSREIVRIA